MTALLQAPVVLPPGLDGSPRHHLSHSSHQLWVACPDAWRRRYLLGEKFPATVPMFIGTACDRALTRWAEARISGDFPELGDVLGFYDAGWEPALADQDLGIRWGDHNPDDVRAEGRQLVEHAFTHLLPFLGRPTGVQRKIEFRLSDAHQWSVQGFLDLETDRLERIAVNPASGEIVQIVAVHGNELVPAADIPDELAIHEREISGVVDFKAKNKHLSQSDADSDFQPSLYLAGRARLGVPADDFGFAVMRRPNAKGQIDTRIIRTKRTPAQMRGALARIAAMANAIVALYEKLGPDQPWPYSDPTVWKCSQKFCDFHSTCWGGSGQ